VLCLSVVMVSLDTTFIFKIFCSSSIIYNTMSSVSCRIPPYSREGRKERDIERGGGGERKGEEEGGE
jgi:hypothetical protein